MAEPTCDDQDKVNEYLSIIQDRIVAPIQATDIPSSCTATLLLLFAAIDGLGKLLHEDKRARSKDRAFQFLDHMGGRYADQKEALWKLRNSLVHSAINVESFLSNTEMRDDQHLKRIGAAGFIYVNTSIMYADLVDAFARFRADMQDNPATLKRAADRLEWKKEDLEDDLRSTGEVTPSLPPPVQFIWAK